MDMPLCFHVGRNNSMLPLEVKDLLEKGILGESKTLTTEIVKTLDITTKNGSNYKQYSAMIKRLKDIGFPIIDLPNKDLNKMNLQLEVLSEKSNAIVSSYKTDELNRSVDPSNKNVSRYSKQDFTKQPRKICECQMNDEYREDKSATAPKCYAILESNSNPDETKHIGIGSKCRQPVRTMFDYSQLETYFTSAIIEEYWKSILLPTLDFNKYNDFTFKRASKLILRFNQDDSLFKEAFFSNNQDNRHLKHPLNENEKGICQDCNSQGFQCVTKQKKNGTKEVFGEMKVSTLDYWGWNDETFDMVGLEQSWNQPKYLQKIDTKEIRSVEDWGMPNFRCRPVWKYTIALVLGRDKQFGFTWVKFQPNERLMNALNQINNVSSENLLFEKVDGGYY